MAMAMGCREKGDSPWVRTVYRRSRGCGGRMKVCLAREGGLWERRGGDGEMDMEEINERRKTERG
jgi:hypothetical protein